MKRFLIIGLLISLTLTGCTKPTLKVEEEVQKGRLVKIKTHLKDTNDESVFVETESGQHDATVIDGYLYYIGNKSDNTEPLKLYKNVIEEKEINFSDTDGGILSIPIEGTNGISLTRELKDITSFGSAYIAPEVKDSNYIYDLTGESENFKLQLRIWRKVEITE